MKKKKIVLEQMGALGASEFEPSWYSTNIFLQGYVDQQFLSLLSKYNHILEKENLSNPKELKGRADDLNQNVSKNNQHQKTENRTKVTCTLCGKENLLFDRQIKQKQIFHPICKLCCGELPI